MHAGQDFYKAAGDSLQIKLVSWRRIAPDMCHSRILAFEAGRAIRYAKGKTLTRDSVTMMNLRIFAALSALALAACQPYGPGQLGAPQIGPDGQPLPVAYRIDERASAEIPVRVLQQVNSLRANVGLAPVTLNPQLTSAALAHSRDMSAQNRAWHWGSDGSSPLDRARRQGYYGNLLGENISETYENDVQTLNAWMATRETRDVIMDPAARDLGFAWYQEPSGKVWWTLVTGG